MSENDPGDLIVKDITMRWKNFIGEERRFNDPGKKNFHLVFDRPELQELHPVLKADGWNITPPKASDGPDDDPEDSYSRDASVEVAVEYKKGRPPTIWLITNEGRTRTRLDDDTVEILQYADIKKMDVVIHPYRWRPEDPGIKAYLHTAYVWLNENELEREYAELFEEIDAAAAMDDD